MLKKTGEAIKGIFQEVTGGSKEWRREITGESERERLIEALYQHLLRIGLTVESKKYARGLFGFLSIRVQLGVVKVVDRSIDFVELESIKSDEDTRYACNYLVLLKTEGLEKTRLRPVYKAFLSGEVVDIKWKGKELAQSLNNDTNLKEALFRLKKYSLVIEPHEQFVRIRSNSSSQPYDIDSAFPTVEAFESFDRIAWHIFNTYKVQGTRRTL